MAVVQNRVGIDSVQSWLPAPGPQTLRSASALLRGTVHANFQRPQCQYVCLRLGFVRNAFLDSKFVDFS